MIRCSFADLLLADLSTSIVFFFDGRLDEQGLLGGLGRALDRLPAFAGRLRQERGRLEIACDGSGFATRAVDSSLTLPEAMSKMTLPECGLVDHVDARAARAGVAPVLTVKVNRLADGGTALGCSWHHAVGDIGSFMTLMRCWSGELYPNSSADEDREALLDSVLPETDCGRPGFRIVDDEELSRLAQSAASAALANRIIQLYFGERETERLRDRLSAAAGRRLSTNDALIAHVVGSVRFLDGDAEDRTLTVPVDLRRQLGLPTDTIGNVLGEIQLDCPGTASTAADGVSETYDIARIARLAASVRVGVENFMQSHLSLRSSRALLEKAGPEGLGSCVPLGYDPPRRNFTASSWRGFGVYDIGFDGLRPVHVSPATSLPLPWVMWILEGFGGSGALCTLALPAALAKRLRSAAGRAALHWCRADEDEVPAIAEGVRRLA